jgi:hypothetical protein
MKVDIFTLEAEEFVHSQPRVDGKRDDGAIGWFLSPIRAALLVRPLDADLAVCLGPLLETAGLTIFARPISPFGRCLFRA